MWPIVKRFWREVVIVALLIMVAISVKTCSSKVAEKESDIKVLEHLADSAFTVAKAYHLKNGELVHQVKTFEVTQSQFKKFADKLIADNASLIKQIGKANNLVGYWKVQAGAQQTVTIKGKDSIIYVNNNIEEAVRIYHWSNNYLTLDQTYHSLDKSITVSYYYNASFELVAYWKGRNLLKRGQLVTDVKFEDPNIKVGEFKGIVIKMDPPKWYETRTAAFVAGAIVGTAGTVYLVTQLK